MDTDMGMDYRDADAGLSQPLHTDSKALRVAVIAGVSFASFSIPLSRLLAFCPKATLNTFSNLTNPPTTENFLPKIDGSTITLAPLLQHRATSNIWAMLLGPEIGMQRLSVAFISPAFLRALRSFAPHVIHLIDPIWLGIQALIALQIQFPGTPIVTSNHTNLPTYAEIFGWFTHRSPALRASWGASSPADVVILSVS
ncbi:hypothetical protein B0H13DRAFT_2415287 [Mycena leptocephala]|nr:hypothetical protein B0H13DRAFT_2415287 [Mycena leptocephala]